MTGSKASCRDYPLVAGGSAWLLSFVTICGLRWPAIFMPYRRYGSLPGQVEQWAALLSYVLM